MMTADVARRSKLGLTAPVRWGADGVSSPEQAFVLPVGTVTFLLTDVAGSTRLWEEEDDEVMRAAIVRHYAIIAEAIDAHAGVRPQEQGEGDSIVAAFARPSDALAAASAAQSALAAEDWPTTQPLRVRMAIHTGEAHLRDDANYAGQAIIRTARLRNIGHGGQVLVSGATRDLAVDQSGGRFDLRSLGEHRLRDLGRPEHVWQLVVPNLVDDFDELVTIDSLPNSLPVSLSPFVGRESEIAELADLVGAERLVTATGTGGAGKTRLAQQVGAELIEQFPAGVWWVELAPLEVDGVESAVRSTFGLSESSKTELEESVRRKLDGERCLLIVDNCEHVAEVVSPLVDRLLRRAPTLHVLATSRVMLDLPGEHAWRVPALALPAPGLSLTVEALSQFDAVRLFCDRARRARPNFELTTLNGPVVAEICHRLGGIPLAIELAAARVRMLDPQRILDGLDDALRILSGGSKAVMARQQTLDASIMWSYDLLSPAEQALLRRLSVFVDGWTLDAAERVCADDDGPLDGFAVFDALDRLVDHSLVHTTDSPVGVRFGMLETVRQYAGRRLGSDPAERSAARRQHCAHLLGWATSLREELLRGGTEELLGMIEAERSNLLAAADFGIEDGDAALALDAFFALVPSVELRMWAPMATAVFALLDRLEAHVDPDDRWRVLLVRHRVTILRGDPVGELALLAELEQSAKDACQPIGECLARCTTLAIFATAGAPVIDELADAIGTVAEYDRGWGLYATLQFGFVAAYRGELALVDRLLADLDRSHLGPIYRSTFDVAEAIVMWSRGEAAVARAGLEAPSATDHGNRSVVNLADGFKALAETDLGVAPTADAEQRVRRAAEIEGNAVGVVSADWFLSLRLLAGDDIAGANAAYGRALAGAMAFGLSDFGPNERYALVAAGMDDYDEVITAVGGPVTTSSNLRGRAEQELRRGNTTRALSLAHEALALALEQRALRSMVFTLECIARTLTTAGHRNEAARLFGACTAFRAERSLVVYPCLRRLLDEARAACRDTLGDDAFETALAEGAALSISDAAEYSRRLRATHTSTQVGWDALTPTEAQVAELVAEGLTNAQVGKELLIGAETVKTHLSRVFSKVGVANRKELIVAASRRAAERHR